MGHTGVVSQRIRTLVRVEGIVQGVGFRPFVYSLATGLGLGGLVGNDVDGVFAEVEGAPEAVGEFMLALRRDAPPLASIERIATSPLRPEGSTAFSIAPSQSGRPAPDARLGRHSRPATTAWLNWTIRRAGGSATRSSTARTAARGSRSCSAFPMTGR